MKKKIDLYKPVKNPRANALRNVVAALNNTVTQLGSIPNRTEEDEHCHWIIRVMRGYYEKQLALELKKPKKR